MIEKLIEILEQLKLDEITCSALFPCPEDHHCDSCPLYTEAHKHILIQELKNANKTK